MSHQKTTSYFCDKCGNQLNNSDNSLNIVTSLREYSSSWSRLHIQITHQHGAHNDWKEEDADLCQSCAYELLADALKRVKAGERLSAGVASSDIEKWE